MKYQMIDRFITFINCNPVDETIELQEGQNTYFLGSDKFFRSGTKIHFNGQQSDFLLILRM